MQKLQKNNKVFLCILDGFSFGDPKNPYNAVEKSGIPNIKNLLKIYPNTMLHTSGEWVGLPNGQMGNSEVGHMAIGCGRVFKQDLVSISDDISSGEFFDKKAIQLILNRLKTTKNSLHIIGLHSDGGVHSHKSHISDVANFFASKDVEVKLHLITDGRDVPPREYLDSGSDLSAEFSEFNKISLATIGGRYYAMDRDGKDERTSLYAKAVIDGCGLKFDSEAELRKKFFGSKGDEFIEPSVISDYQGVKSGDIFFVANFRSDRVRQIVKYLEGFNGHVNIDSSDIFTMTKYYDDFGGHVLYKKDDVVNSLSDIVSGKGISQTRISETEKYAHVTFFFNGGKEGCVETERRFLIPSPKVKTYDEKPEMSIFEVKNQIIDIMKSGRENHLIVANIANGDMVGHTGNFTACVQAAKYIDDAIFDLYQEALSNGYTMIITADHGNLEEMVDCNGEIHTQHTTGKVPFILIDKNFSSPENVEFIENGTLANIAPTILKIYGIDKPEEMLQSLFKI